MAELMPDKIRNIALVSHPGAGKTSLVDIIAYRLGAVDRLGKVDEGTSVSDFNEDEKKRGMSIDSTIFSFDKEGFRINIIDTPGYLEFIGGVIGSLKAVDSAIVLIDGSSGIEIGTERAWGLLGEDLPRGILINKVDEENINLRSLLEELRKNFGKECVLFQVPNSIGSNYSGSKLLLDEDVNTDFDIEVDSMRKELIESIADTSDELLEEYLETETLSQEKLEKGLRKGIVEKKIVPIFCGSTQVPQYADSFIDSILRFYPSPNDKDGIESMTKGEERVAIESKPDNPFCAQVFKTVIDPYIGQLSIFRVFSGTINSGSSVYNTSTNSTEKLGQLYLLQGKAQKEINNLIPGDIGAVAKLKNTNISDTLCDSSRKITLPRINFPEPVLSVSITPQSREDEKKLSQALKKLEKEDGSFESSRDLQTRELIVSGMGSLHLEIMVERLKQRFGVKVEVGTPQVPYKETITDSVKVQYKHKKQSGGRGQYGEVYLELVPLSRDAGFKFENRIKGGAIPQQYIPAVEKGVKDTMKQGVLAGYPVVDLKAIVYDGSFHSVDSSDMAFQIAASMAMKRGLEKAQPVLLEPIMDVTVTVEEEFMGQINKNISSRRGKIMGMETRGTLQAINAKVPLSEMLKYASELKSMTGGRGAFTMNFSHYEQVPYRLSEKIVAEKNRKDKKNEKK